jgi:hypothetical protein
MVVVVVDSCGGDGELKNAMDVGARWVAVFSGRETGVMVPLNLQVSPLIEQPRNGGGKLTSTSLQREISRGRREMKAAMAAASEREVEMHG